MVGQGTWSVPMDKIRVSLPGEVSPSISRVLLQLCVSSDFLRKHGAAQEALGGIDGIWPQPGCRITSLVFQYRQAVRDSRGRESRMPPNAATRMSQKDTLHWDSGAVRSEVEN